MGIEMPDININKIREEFDKKNAEMEKKERERIEEEYKRLSGQEKPTEENPEGKIEEKKEKTEKEEEEDKKEEIYRKLRLLDKEYKKLEGQEYISPDDEKRMKKIEEEHAKLDKQAKEPEEKEEEPSAAKAMEDKEKEALEKEITERFYDELKKIKDMPDKARGFIRTGELKMEKTEKCFALIEEWKDYGYLDDYKGIQNIFSELDRLKPSIFLYGLKKAQTVNKVGLTMALNYKEWGLKDKEKLKIIKDFVNKQSKEKNIFYSIFYSKDKTLKEIAQILASKDIPYKGNIDVIVKNIENPDIKAKTIASISGIEKESIEKKKQSLQALKKDMKRDKLPPDEIIIEQLEKLGVDPKVLSKILSKAPELVETLKNPEVQKRIQELRNTIEKVTKEKGEIPEAVAKAKDHIEKKESGWGTALGTTGWIISFLLVLALLVVVLGVDYFTGLAGGKKKEKK